MSQVTRKTIRQPRDAARTMELIERVKTNRRGGQNVCAHSTSLRVARIFSEIISLPAIERCASRVRRFVLLIENCILVGRDKWDPRYAIA